ncbi:GPR158 [Mytilus coruscus]|uniref:GPR158 n=1 Tax=Mytilus coruscus TaxID=42192 RepID=A0A6J8AZ92_MYTCO|nr:GPR158 [Mytilus coruscus]
MFLLIILMVFWQTCDNHAAGHTGKEAAKLALEYVSRIEKNPCTGGTEETLDLTFNHTAWEKYTQPAILTSNFLSSVIIKNNGSLDSLTDEMFFSLVRNNVNSLKTVFGSCIAIEPGIYSKYSSFAPYAYRQNEIVFSHNIALSYMYHGNKTEWYFNLKIRNWENATRTAFKTKYRAGTISLPEQEIVVLTAKLEDGHWTKPYFDCGGGDIWMVTFSSPIFSLDLTGRPKFQGIASVDIQLTNIDINQCDQDSTHIYSDIDVFRGTHRCPSTTEVIKAGSPIFLLLMCAGGLLVCTMTKPFSFSCPELGHFENMVEALLLLIGVYMCYVVRKAPGHFNESKYITWSVYNGILLGSFLLILTHVIGHSHGPDMLYLFKCLQIQVFATITLTLIYVPKLIALYRNEDIKKGSNTLSFPYGTKNNRTNSIDIIQAKATHSYEIQTAAPKPNYSSKYLKTDTTFTQQATICPTKSIGTQTHLNMDMDNL